MFKEMVSVKREALVACMTCPICNHIFTDATTISECLHTFCTKCICKKFSDEELERCPVCDIDLGVWPEKKLRPDHNLEDLRAKIFPYKRRNLDPSEDVSSFALPSRRKEKSLSSLVVNSPRVSSKTALTGRRDENFASFISRETPTKQNSSNGEPSSHSTPNIGTEKDVDMDAQQNTLGLQVNVTAQLSTQDSLVNVTLVGQLLSIHKIFQKYKVISVSDETAGTSTAKTAEAAELDAAHEEAMCLRRELFKKSQIFNLLSIKEGSGCSAALIQIFCERFDKKRQAFNVNDEVEIRFCVHQVAKVLSINHSGKTLKEVDKVKTKVTHFPDFLVQLKSLYVTKTGKREKEDRGDNRKVYLRTRRELSTKSLIEILQRMPIVTDEQKDQYQQLARLYVVDQFFLPSSEFKYTRVANYTYCTDEDTFESINWAQEILDRIHIAAAKKIRTYDACSSVLQALIYDKIPSLIAKDKKLKPSSSVPADLYPIIRKKKEVWKLELDKVSSQDIQKCELCSRFDPAPHSLMFQKACDSLILAHLIAQSRQLLEGSLEGDYLMEIDDFTLVEGLKNEYLGTDGGSDWELFEALTLKDASEKTSDPRVE